MALKADPARRAALLAGWLRRTRASGHAGRWVLRGSVVTAALCRDARPPVDVDYVLAPTAADFDPDRIAAEVRAIAARPDPSTALMVPATEVIFGETASPGVRAHLAGSLLGDGGGDRDDRDGFQIDLAVGDPMIVPPRAIAVAEVGPVLACAGETLFGWKLHGLCEYGPGRWRAKDLYDLDVLWRQGGLELAATRAAVSLAFSSRGLALSALDDFRRRPRWGCSRGGVRKWRALRAGHAAVDDFAPTVARVRAAIDQILQILMP
jgi:hypothetical protein